MKSLYALLAFGSFTLLHAQTLQSFQITSSVDCNACVKKGYEYCSYSSSSYSSTGPRGRCCAKSLPLFDSTVTQCQQNTQDQCSSNVYQPGLKLMLCPNQSNCGKQEVFTVTADGITIKQDQGSTISPKFTNEQVCHYEIGWPSTAKIGDVIYLNVVTLRNVKTYIYIAETITQDYVVLCDQVAPGDFLIATYPKKFFISFVSETSDSTAFYYFNANYETFKKYDFKNDIRCAGVTNVKPDIIINTTVPSTPPPPVLVQSNVQNLGLQTLKLVKQSLRQDFEDIAMGRFPNEIPGLVQVSDIIKDSVKSESTDWFVIIVMALGVLMISCGLITIFEWCRRNKNQLCFFNARNSAPLNPGPPLDAPDQAGLQQPQESIQQLQQDSLRQDTNQQVVPSAFSPRSRQLINQIRGNINQSMQRSTNLLSRSPLQNIQNDSINNNLMNANYDSSPQQIPNLLMRQQMRQSRVDNAPMNIILGGSQFIMQSNNGVTNDTGGNSLDQIAPSSIKAKGKKKRKKRIGDSKDSITDIIDGISAARGIDVDDQRRAIDFYAGQSFEEQKVPRVRLNPRLAEPSPARDRPSVSLVSVTSNYLPNPTTRNNQLPTIQSSHNQSYISNNQNIRHQDNSHISPNTSFNNQVTIGNSPVPQVRQQNNSLLRDAGSILMNDNIMRMQNGHTSLSN